MEGVVFELKVVSRSRSRDSTNGAQLNVCLVPITANMMLR